MGSRCRCGDEAELLDHLQPVEHQVERDVLPLAEAEHLGVVQIDGAPGRLELAHGAVEDAVMGPGERALLDRDVLTVSPEEMQDTKVVWTMVAGKKVYQAK